MEIMAGKDLIFSRCQVNTKQKTQCFSASFYCHRLFIPYFTESNVWDDQAKKVLLYAMGYTISQKISDILNEPGTSL